MFNLEMERARKGERERDRQTDKQGKQTEEKERVVKKKRSSKLKEGKNAGRNMM